MFVNRQFARHDAHGTAFFRRIRTWAATISVVFPTIGFAAPIVSGPAAAVFFNGNVYTVDPSHPKASALVVEQGRIVYVGDTTTARQKAPQGAKLIDLEGATLLPGLTDSHAHIAGIGFRELSFNLEGVSGIADLQKRLRDYAAGKPANEWIVSGGWIETHWSPSRFPTRADIDSAVADRPVLLMRADYHAAVANSEALRRAHIDRHTPDPAGGKILRDAQGDPTGMLVDNAVGLVSKLEPPASEAAVAHALEVGAAREVRLGWTSIHAPGNAYSQAMLIRKLIAAGRIKLRIFATVQGPGADADRLLAEGPHHHDLDGRFTLDGIKLFIDGALGSRGAALLAPYSDGPGNTGLLVNDPKVLYPLLERALRSGIQIQTHAIGDRGNRIMLDLYERAFRAVPPEKRAVREPRWRIEHAQILSPEDIPRFARLGVIASMQPSHAIGDLYFAPARLGPGRLAGAYAWHSLLESGAVIAAGSDAPVERGEPMIEFYAAVARRSMDGFANEDWHLEQRVSREQALKMLTLWPAYAAFRDKDLGSIEVGKQADFTVLSRDIMTIPDAEILQTSCVMTVIAGEVVYDRLRARQ